MEIKLTWDNPNTLYDGTYVYRSEEPLDVNNLPPAIADLPNGVTEYVDRDVVRGTKYYYRFGVYRGDDITVSGQKEVWALPYTGPGPQSLIAGDWETGYFGEVTAPELFTGEELAAMVGLQVGTLINNASSWFKFADKGKILYISKLPIRRSISWMDLFDLDCVYGTDELGKKVITKNRDDFIVRLMRGLGEGVTEGNVDMNPFPDFTGNSEWDRLFARCLYRVSDTQRGENFSDNQMASVIAGNNGQYTLCQEDSINDPAKVIVRGRANEADYNSFISQVQRDLRDASHGWRPVLEYIMTHGN